MLVNCSSEPTAPRPSAMLGLALNQARSTDQASTIACAEASQVEQLGCVVLRGSMASMSRQGYVDGGGGQLFFGQKSQSLRVSTDADGWY